MVSALPEDFYRHVEKNFADRIPVVRGNFENWWNWGVGSTAYETAAHKNTQDTLAAGEMLATFACAAGRQAAYPYEELATAWKNMVLYAEHTWGPNGSAVNSQWFWKRNTALGPEAAAARVLRESMSALNAGIATDGPAVVVWNFAPWSRTDVARLEAGSLPQGAALIDAATGKPAVVQATGDGATALLATDVPALGYKMFRVDRSGGAPAADGPGGLAASPDTLENRFFRIRFDANGDVVSIADKRRGGRELVDANCPHRLNQFIYWFQGKTPFSVSKAKLIPAVGPAMASMTAEGACFGVDSMKRTVILHRDLPRIDIVNDLVKSPSGFGQKGKGWQKEEGYFVFPFNVANFTLRHEMPTGNVRPLVDPNPGEPEQLPSTCTDHFTVNRWVEVSNQKDFGVTLSCLDAPLVMYGQRRARTFDVNYKARTPWIYGYVFNNLWYTNFQKTQPGRVVFRYSLRPHDGGDWRAGQAHRFGIETNSPLRAGRIAGKQAGSPGLTTPAGSLLTIDQPNVMLIAAKLAEANGEGVILRFVELEGRRTQATVDLARLTPRAVTATDLVENDLSPVTLNGTKASFEIAGFGYATLRLTFGSPPAAVANVRATADAHGALVAWDAVGGAVHYEVFRGSAPDFAPGGGTYLATVSVNRFLDRQVNAAVTGKYHYRVRAARAGRKGPFSPPAAATVGAIGDATPPTSPALSAKALRFDKIALSWETPTDDVAVKGYKLFRDGKALADLPVVYNAWMDLRTDPNTDYTYTIQAYDDAGNLSSPSAAKVGTHGFVVPPGTPPAAALQAMEAAPAGPRPPAAKTPKPGNIAPMAALMVSSEYGTGFAAKCIVDGWCGQHERGEWASKREARPWVRLEWKEPVTVATVVVYDRANASDHAKAGRLTFSEGDPIAVGDIPNDGSPRAVAVPPRKVKWLKFEVTESAGANIGLSEIEVFGAK